MAKRYFFYVILIPIVFLSIIIYWNTLQNEFVNFDDLDLVVRNKYVKSLSYQNIKDIFTPGVVGTYQPVRTLSYAIDYHFWKLNPTGYHVTNILCHACSTLLVFLIAYLLTKRSLIAATASLFFAVHPLHVEAVTWIAGRRDVLSSFLALLAVYCFLLARPPQDDEHSEQPAKLLTTLFYLFSLGFFALGLLTKASVVILPILLVLYDVCFLPSIRKHWRRLFIYLPFFLISCIHTLVFLRISRATGVVESSYHGGDAYTTLLTMLRVFGEYVIMLFVPKNLSATYGVTTVHSILEPAFLISLAVLVVAALFTVWTWKKSKLAFFGIVWFFISLIPVSNIIPIAIIKADRYLYFPSVGFCLMIAWLIARGWTALSNLRSSKSGKLLIASGYWVMIGVVIVLYSFQTFQRNQDWKDSHTLWTATLETHPDSSIALNNLGLIYEDQGMHQKALALYQNVLEIHPDQEHIERIYGNIGDVYRHQKMYEEAIDYYQKALEVDPEYIPTYLGLGSISVDLGHYDNAEKIYMAALELDNRNERIYTHLGNLYVAQRRYDEAIIHFQKSLKLDPFSINAYNGLGLSYIGKSEIKKALSLYQKALEQDPGSPVIHNSLGTLYMQIGDIEKAITEFTAVLQGDPENAEVQNNLGILYLRAKQYKEAAQHFITALKYQPNNPKMLTNLGITYMHVGLFDEAIQAYQWALESDPSLFRAHVLLGDVCLRTERIDCAIKAYENALKLQPNQRKLQEKLEIAREKSLGEEK